GWPGPGGAVLPATATRWTRRTTSSAPWPWTPCATGRPASWPTGSSGCSRSRSRWRPGRACSCWTSRRRGGRAARGPAWSRRSRGSRRLSRCCSSSTTWAWSSASPAASSSWSAAGSWWRGSRPRSRRTPACGTSTWAGRSVAEPLLALRHVRAGYGDAVVLDDISLEIPERGSLAVLGRNGVGKSTLLLTIMGYTDVGRGTIAGRGADVTAVAPHRRARRGLGWVAQEREVFPSLTVEENLTVAARRGRWDLAAVCRLFPPLAGRRRQRAGH